jgi:Cu-Zn family superoxide dismutase
METGMIKSIAPAFTALALSGCATLDTPARPAWASTATATLRDSAGNVVGTADLLRRGDEWKLGLGVSGQTPGDHGIHLHMVGKCNAPDFASAGGHLNPAGRAHGSANPAGMHMGDLPNLTIGADGTASTFMALPAGTDAAALFDADGTAIVIHAKPDDYLTDPAGNSGPRLACGVLTPK